MSDIVKKMLGIPTRYTEEEYINAYRKLRKHNPTNIPSANRIEFEVVESDDKITDIADKIGFGIPVVINFSNADVRIANKVISFLSGCLYPLNGEVIQIKERIYLFASEDNLKDGSLKEFVLEHK